MTTIFTSSDERRILIDSLLEKIEPSNGMYSKVLELCDVTIIVAGTPKVDIREKFFDGRKHPEDYAARSADGSFRHMLGSYSGIEQVYLRSFLGPIQSGQIRELSPPTILRGVDKHPPVSEDDKYRFDCFLAYIRQNVRK